MSTKGILCGRPVRSGHRPFACGPTDGSRRPDAVDATDPQASDTATLNAIYAQIDGVYDSLMTRYASMASGLPADQRQVYQAMHRMYGQSTAMRRLMLSDSMMSRGATGRRWA